MIRTITVLLVFLTITAISASAQLTLQTFVAEDGYNTALDKAKETSEDVQFLAIGTTTGEFDTGTMGKINLEYDLKGGKATVWSYVFKDVNADELLYIGVVKVPVIGFMAMNLSQGQMGRFSDVVPSQELTGNWLGSAKFATEYQKNQVYIGFFNLPDNPNINYVALGRNILEPEDKNPYWVLNANIENYVLTCLMNAYDGTVTCESAIVESVDENLLAEETISCYPNPVNDFAIIKIPFSLQRSTSILAIYDMQGNEVKRLVNPDGQTENLILNIKDLALGKYLISYISGNTKHSATLVVIR